MSAQPQTRMTVDEFLVWADGRDGKWELVNGEVVAMSPERVRHAQAKFAAGIALRAAIGKAALPCRVLVDGVAVRIDQRTSYVPDVLCLLRRACRPRPDGRTGADRRRGGGFSLFDFDRYRAQAERLFPRNYFRVTSIMHYIIVDPAAPIVIHHRRGDDGTIEARILGAGKLDLDPPGLSLDVGDFFSET